MKSHLLSLLLTTAITTATYASEIPSPKLTQTLTTLLDATLENDLQKFESVCDKRMRQAMNELSLQGAHEQIAEKMKAGYTPIYLGFLDHITYTIHLWKLDFKESGTPDTLAQLTWTGTKVSGFFLR